MQTTRPAIVLLTRDLRLRDNPALDAAIRRAGTIVPVFVLDDRLLSGPRVAPNRVRFLLESLQDLRSSLRTRGADLIVRRGDAATEVITLASETAADSVFCADDVSGYATAMRRRLAAACWTARLELRTLPGVTVVPPGELRPTSGSDHFKVFTPYLRAWQAAALRAVAQEPATVRIPPGIPAGDLPALSTLTSRPVAAGGLPGGEAAGLRRRDAWLSSSAARYEGARNDLASDATSRLSSYLHFGCLSPLELALLAGPSPLRRQLAWRDFFFQLTAAFPAITSRDYRRGRDSWREDSAGLDAWRQGQTGVPIVDAGMRQLLAEGWMHNRARMITASFLCRQLRIDWRLGARHFMDQLTDGDVACNYGNWQWVAGTGNDSRPGRVPSPLRQAGRFDPDGDYVRRYVPELAGLDAAAIHQPWTLPARQRPAGYPAPVIDVHQAAPQAQAAPPAQAAPQAQAAPPAQAAPASEAIP